jgi:hypothetical protein
MNYERGGLQNGGYIISDLPGATAGGFYERGHANGVVSVIAILRQQSRLGPNFGLGARQTFQESAQFS